MTFVEHLRKRVEDDKVSLAGAEKAAAAANQKVSQLRDRISAYKKTLKAEMELSGHIVVDDNPIIEDVPDEPIKTDFVLEEIRKAPATGLKPKTILTKCEAAGINLSRNYIYTVIARLKEKGKITEQEGKYFPVAQDEVQRGESLPETGVEKGTQADADDAAQRSAG